MSDASTLVECKDSDSGPLVIGHGSWSIGSARALAEALDAVRADGRGRRLCIDLSDVGRLDTTGAWLLARLRRRLEDEGSAAEITGLGADRVALVEQSTAGAQAVSETLDLPRTGRPGRGQRVRNAALAPGRVAAGETISFLSFIGEVALAVARVATRRGRLPATAVLHHMQQVWINALPIVGMLTFVVGAAITFMGGAQLDKFQAEIYVINLIALAMLREVGVIVAAIVVAGRSGSAFTVEIGTMQTRQEVDAMRASGIDPYEALVLPRLLAIVLTMPFLGLFGDIMGLAGGGMAAVATLGITPQLFMERLHQVVELKMFAAGIVKTPVLAAIIGLIGCWQGMRVTAGVEELGGKTTSAVVQALFLVLLTDSLSSVALDMLGL